MSGAFRPTFIARVGQHRYWNKKFRLSQNQKAGVRQRLRDVDRVIATLHESRVPCAGLEEALAMKKEHELTPKEKYFVFSGNNPKTHMKPVTHVPKFTKVPHPRGFPLGY